jgi:RNA-directed DNA polymerase
VYDSGTRADLSRGLAYAFLAGTWSEVELVTRALAVLDARPRWVRPIARDVLASYHRPPADRARELAAFIDLALERRSSLSGEEHAPRVRRWLSPDPAMGRRRWPVPELPSVGALSDFLELTSGELAWLADARALERTVGDERLRNYRYGVLPRKGGPPRVIERPKPRLKSIQRRVLHEILDWIPAHDAAHGFTRGRSAVTHARRHTGQFVVVSLDLEDFFASIAVGRVFGIFRTAGYPESVAHALTALTTNVVPLAVWHQVRRPATTALIDPQYRLGRRLATPHLPQGAPTSPSLANLAGFRLDRRLSGIAAATGMTYSRYADDLTFSGSRRLLGNANQLRSTISQIAREEGFTVNRRKSMLVTRAGRQQVCGIVVNEHANVPRRDYDVLRATLHNAARLGPASQNRAGVPDFRAHLLGRIAWVEQLHPPRGERLRRQFDRIAWDEAAPARC